jgi:hypothetical protein
VENEPEGIVREGDRLTYKGNKYVRGRPHTLFCSVTDLHLAKGYSQNSPGETPEMKPSFNGKVRLQDDTISVVGTDLSRISELNLFIALAAPQGEPTPLTEEQRAAKAARHEERRKQGLCPLDWRDAIYGQDATTRIGFSPYDWETGTPERLWLHVDAPRAMFDALQSAFEAGRLWGISLGLETGLWMEETGLWITGPTEWFLFPERVYGSSDRVCFEVAYGWLSFFHIKSAPLRLGTQAEDSRQPAANDPITPPIPARTDADLHASFQAAAPPAITDADRRTLRSISLALWCLVVLAVLALLLGRYG